MGDTAMTVVVIIAAVAIMGIFPLMGAANQTDDTTNLTVQTATTEFVNEIRSTGTLTMNNYENFTATLAATGNSYDTNIEVQIADGNLAKKESTTSSDKIYLTKYNTQIMEELNGNNGGKVTFNEGDVISVSVQNTNTTIAQQLRNIINKVTGNNSSAIVGEATGMITRTGN